MIRKEISMEARKKISRKVAERYQKVREKEKSKILDEFVNIMGYNRSYASWLLRNWGRKVVVWGKGKRIVFVGEKEGKKGKRGKKKIYDEKVLEVLKKIWYILDFPCGKRLADYMEEIMRVLEQKGILGGIDNETRGKLLKISGRTIDRLLKGEKEKLNIKGRKGTKPGSLLKNQIPIKTFSEWDDKRPGFIEIDLVEHNGAIARGIYAQSLDTTDVCTGWTETICVENKSQVKVFEGLKKIIKQYPFQILGIDSDNGSEFINHHLIKFCEENKITFTRARPYRKNDSCYVEQKNWSVIRKTVGYYRHETKKEVEVINKIYQLLRLYTNFFQPQTKCIEKIRIGSKIIKKYDKAKTPYQRVIENPYIPLQIKEKLKRQYEMLNPVEIKSKILKLQKYLHQITLNNPFYTKRRQEKKEEKAICVGVDF